MVAADIAKVAAVIYAVETLSLASQGEVQTLTPEAFVPAAVKIVRESERAVGMGLAEYVAEADRLREAATTDAGPGDDEVAVDEYPGTPDVQPDDVL